MSEFDALVGKEFNFFGVDNLHFKIGNAVWKAVEDEADGYRSYLDSIEESTDTSLVFPDKPFAHVRIERSDDTNSEGFRLIDTHRWPRMAPRRHRQHG